MFSCFFFFFFFSHEHALFSFFFFQAEDGIRDADVTGVQTCALPISLCEVPVVIVNVQRVGPSTGMPTLPAQGDVMQARWGTHGDHPVVVLAPASVADTYRL